MPEFDLGAYIERRRVRGMDVGEKEGNVPDFGPRQSFLRLVISLGVLGGGGGIYGGRKTEREKLCLSRGMVLTGELNRLIDRDPHGPGGFMSGKGVDVMHGRDHTHSQTPEVNSNEMRLSKVFENKEWAEAEIEYEYDFGDHVRLLLSSSHNHTLRVFGLITPSNKVKDANLRIANQFQWCHQIKLIGRAAATAKFVCVDGSGHGVAEDAGSSEGWENLKKAYRTDSPSAEQLSKREWFEKKASNKDPKGLAGSRAEEWDMQSINLMLSVRR